MLQHVTHWFVSSYTVVRNNTHNCCVYVYTAWCMSGSSLQIFIFVVRCIFWIRNAHRQRQIVRFCCMTWTNSDRIYGNHRLFKFIWRITWFHHFTIYLVWIDGWTIFFWARRHENKVKQNKCYEKNAIATHLFQLFIHLLLLLLRL